MTGTEATWPLEFRGVTESVVATRGPEGQWNLAALGLFPGELGGGGGDGDGEGGGDGDGEGGGDGDGKPDASVTARTWGRTRTWHNFRERGAGVVQFTRDPVHFVDAALSVWEREEPVVESADAWARVAAERADAGEEDGTQWVEWSLAPVEAEVRNRVVPTTNRGYYAAVEASVAASRLGVAGYDDDTLRARIDYLGDVVARCGDDRAREAFGRLRSHVDVDALDDADE